MPSVRIVTQSSFGKPRRERPIAELLIWVRHGDLAPWFEVWAKENLKIHICEDLWVPSGSNEDYQAVEAITRKRLPAYWREFLGEARIVKEWTIERRRPFEEVRRLEAMDWLASLERFQKKFCRGETT